MKEFKKKMLPQTNFFYLIGELDNQGRIQGAAGNPLSLSGGYLQGGLEYKPGKKSMNLKSFLLHKLEDIVKYPHAARILSGKTRKVV